MSTLGRLLVGFGLFLVSALWYAIVSTTAGWVVLMAGTVLFLLALSYDERSR